MSWREASSVIIAAAVQRNQKHLFPYNYKLLLLKRSDKSSFYPRNFVFPGGMLDTNDDKEEWLKLFQSYNLTEHVQKLVIDDSHLPSLFKKNSNTPHRLHPQLALRITAIREAFEEAGVLLCRKKNQMPCGLYANVHICPELFEWRKRVEQNNEAFLDLCLNLDVYPDLWGLHLWSNWLTPALIHRKRYDTSFFFASVNQIPNAIEDTNEIQTLEWGDPNCFLNRFINKDIFLPPPQFYELSRFNNFQNLDSLVTFAKNRNENCIRFLPFIHELKDGQLSLLPGDEDYPKDVNSYDVDKFKNHTSNELANGKIMHRMITTNESNIIFTKNYVPPDGHVIPKPDTK